MLANILARLANGLNAIGRFVRGLSGFRRFLFALAMGLLSALAFEPVNFAPALLIGFAALVLVIDGAHDRARPIRNAAFAGWAFGYGHFLAGLYWVGYAFLVDASSHEWQLPLVAVVFPGGLALFTALACTLAAFSWRPGAARILLFTAAYAITEWLRGHIFTGFPWNLPGYAWGGAAGMLQVVSVIGIYGLSVLTILFGAVLALLFSEDRMRHWPLIAGIVVAFAIVDITGSFRLANAPDEMVPGVALRIVQPNVAQADKYRIDQRQAHWRDLVLLSVERHGKTPTHIIWPEAAPPFLLTRVPEALDDIAILTSRNQVLMTGALRAETAPGKLPRFFNSFYVFAHGGRLIASYDKFHLVPFGEYLPMEPVLSALGLSKIVGIEGSFVAGDGPHTLSVPGAPDTGPLICYEILFPGAVIGETRPGWLVNVTDDSWFGPPSSSGPVQHFLIARVRAIEEGLAVARAANTGISAVIDPFGRVIAKLDAGKKGVVDASLPQALPATVYARWGDLAFWLLLAGLLAASQFIAPLRR